MMPAVEPVRVLATTESDRSAGGWRHMVVVGGGGGEWGQGAGGVRGSSRRGRGVDSCLLLLPHDDNLVCPRLLHHDHSMLTRGGSDDLYDGDNRVQVSR
jgi:hypothetical protein